MNADVCSKCGESFSLDYVLTLNNALRMGGIARQMDISEEDVLQSEKYYENIRKEMRIL